MDVCGLLLGERGRGAAMTGGECDGVRRHRSTGGQYLGEAVFWIVSCHAGGTGVDTRQTELGRPAGDAEWRFALASVLRSGERAWPPATSPLSHHCYARYRYARQSLDLLLFCSRLVFRDARLLCYRCR